MLLLLLLLRWPAHGLLWWPGHLRQRWKLSRATRRACVPQWRTREARSLPCRRRCMIRNVSRLTLLLLLLLLLLKLLRWVRKQVVLLRR
jgi:hypothetical protein